MNPPKITIVKGFIEGPKRTIDFSKWKPEPSEEMTHCFDPDEIEKLTKEYSDKGEVK